LNCVITSGWCPWRIDSESARVLANDSQSLSRVPTRVPTVLVPVWSEGVMTSQKDTTRHERTGGPVAGELLFCFDVTLRCTLIPYQFAGDRPETVVSWHRAGFRLFWTWKVPQKTRTTCPFG